jgi:hypothetical protein
VKLAALAIFVGGVVLENPVGADPLARVHALGVAFNVEYEELPRDRAITESDVRAAVERRNKYWLNDDFDRAQALNHDLVDADLLLAFLRALPDQPADVLAAFAALKGAPVDLARPDWKLRRGVGVSARAYAGAWKLRREGGRFVVELPADADELARELRLAAAEEPPRQAALDAIDAQLAKTPSPEPKQRVERQNAYRRLIVMQRARLQLSRALAASLGADGKHEELTTAALEAEIARLQAALKNAPAWGSRLPPPPPRK